MDDDFYSTYDFYAPGRDAVCGEWEQAVDRRAEDSQQNPLVQPHRNTVRIGQGEPVGHIIQSSAPIRLLSRTLEPSEVRLLSDAVSAFPGISQRQCEQLLEKLGQGLSRWQREHCRPLVVGRPPVAPKAVLCPQETKQVPHGQGVVAKSYWNASIKTLSGT